MDYTQASWNDLKHVLNEKLYGGRNKLYPKKPGIHIAAAAWIDPKGDIYTGQDHTEAAKRAARLGNAEAQHAIVSKYGVHDVLRAAGWKDGFLTSERKWVSREDGMNLARQKKQLKNADPVSATSLDSYDVITPSR